MRLVDFERRILRDSHVTSLRLSPVKTPSLQKISSSTGFTKRSIARFFLPAPILRCSCPTSQVSVFLNLLRLFLPACDSRWSPLNRRFGPHFLSHPFFDLVIPPTGQLTDSRYTLRSVGRRTTVTPVMLGQTPERTEAV